MIVAPTKLRDFCFYFFFKIVLLITLYKKIAIQFNRNKKIAIQLIIFSLIT